MTTAADIIQFAARKAGLLGEGQAWAGQDVSDALADLNDMIDQWRVQRNLVYHLVDFSITSTGVLSYTVGPAGSNIVCDPRPDRLESAFLRQTNNSATTPIDTPLEIIAAYENYSRIRAKQVGTFARWIFYDSGWPQGVLFPWPVPQAGIYEIHIQVKAILQAFPLLTTVVNLPPGYSPALKWNLARVLRTSYGKKESSGVNSMAATALNVLRLGNVQVPTLTMPRQLGNRSRSYDYRSDT